MGFKIQKNKIYALMHSPKNSTHKNFRCSAYSAYFTSASHFVELKIPNKVSDKVFKAIYNLLL